VWSWYRAIPEPDARPGYRFPRCRSPRSSGRCFAACETNTVVLDDLSRRRNGGPGRASIARPESVAPVCLPTPSVARAPNCRRARETRERDDHGLARSTRPKEQSKASVRPAPAQTPVRAVTDTALDRLPGDDARGLGSRDRPGPGSRSRGSSRRLRAISACEFHSRVRCRRCRRSLRPVRSGLWLLKQLRQPRSARVHAGSVDLSGLTHDQTIAKLQSAYGYLAQGEVTITTPVGATTITYQQAGRGPDVQAMADAALALATRATPSRMPRALFIPRRSARHPGRHPDRSRGPGSTDSAARRDELDCAAERQATAKGGAFSFTPSTPDTASMSCRWLHAHRRAHPDERPCGSAGGGTFTTLSPQITDTDAQNAIALAQKMIVDVNLTWSTPPAAAPSSWKPQTWTIPAAQIRSWIVFGTQQDGTYAPAVDPAQVEAYLSSISRR